MKNFIIFFILLLCFTNGYSKEVTGYIITNENDTLPAKFKAPRSYSNFNYKELKIIDSSNESKKLTPQEIKGFGFKENEKDIVYLSKPTKKGNLYFLEQVITGPNTSLYQYVTAPGQYGSGEEYYRFEKPGSDPLFMTNFGSLENFRINLGQFYKEYPEATKLIEMKFNARRHIQDDIREILQAVNKS